MGYNLIFDTTSKTIKAAVVNSEGQIISIEYFEPEIIRTEDGFGRAFNHKNFGEMLVNVAKKAIEKSKIQASQIRYITASSIRPSSVFTDDKNNPLYIAASFDLCGIEKADELEHQFFERTGKTLYESTGHSPSLLFAPAKYAAIREFYKHINQDLRIDQYMPLDSWILVHFGAESHTNYTSAAETGFFDLESRCWHDVWNDLLDLPEFFFQLPVFSGEIVGSISDEIQKRLGLSSECELVAGLPDTQAALLGMGCVQTGSIAAVLGSTTPVQSIVDNLYQDKQQNLWSSIISVKNVCDKYIIETNTGITGQIVKWAANLFYSEDSNLLKDRYLRLDNAFAKFDAMEFERPFSDINIKSAFAFLGPQPLASNRAAISPGLFYFPSPGGVEESYLSQPDLIGTVFDNILFGVNSNIEFTKRIQQTLGNKIPRLCITGGISRNSTLCQRFADITQSNIHISSDPESTIIGLNYLCLIANQEIRSKNDLFDDITDHRITKIISPRESMGLKINEKFAVWNKLRKNFLK